MALNLALIVIVCLILDAFLRRLGLPGLLGMLLVGVLAGPYVWDLLSPELIAVSADFRRLALIVILLRAGLKTRASTLLKVGRQALLLACLPVLAEIAGVTLAAPPLLGISLLDAAVLAAVLAAVSPAVVVPLMIRFMEEGRGTDKGIPSMLLAASAGDNVFAIVLFGVFMGFHAGGGSWLLQLGAIPVSLFLGVLLGGIAGLFWYAVFEKYPLSGRKALFLVGTAILMTALEDHLAGTVPLAGLLAVMTMGFVILEKAETAAHRISDVLGRFWVFAEILLFVLVGAQVNVQVAWKAGLAGSVVIGAGILCRSLGVRLALAGSPLSGGERRFTTVAWVPKATVQAAVGAIPLSAGLPGGEVILAVAVLSILLTAPAGSVATLFAGRRLLARAVPASGEG